MRCDDSQILAPFHSNHWLKVKCVETVSNRDGIGAKVRIKAAIREEDTWQMREISGGTGFGQTSLLAHFGLGRATLVETVRIEWPSGAVQELHKIDPDRTITVIEPPKLEGAKLTFPNIEFNVAGLPGTNYLIDISTDFLTWTAFATVTNSTRLTRFVDLISPASTHRFYRARNP